LDILIGLAKSAFPTKMLKLLRAMALLRAAHAQYSGGASLPTVDLGYEVYQASNFNVRSSLSGLPIHSSPCLQDTGNFYNFSNIRYAAPPVGELRFAPPQPPAENRSTVNDGGTSRYAAVSRGNGKID
jgi:acetylcholinesterase